MDKDKKEKIRNNRRCIIFGCNSSSLKDKELKFFRFPSPGSRDYPVWLSACKDSYNQIRVLKKPLICSLHFVPEDVGGRRLNPNAYPKVRLHPSKGFIDFQERETKIKFLNQVMEEWLVRNRPFREIYGKLLIERAREATDLLDIPSYSPDKSWLKGFNAHIADPNSRLFGKLDTCGSSLHMTDIIRDMKQLQEKYNRQQQQFSGTEDSIEISDDEDDYEDVDYGDSSYADLSSKLEVSVMVDEDDDDEHYEPGRKMPKLQSILLDLDDDEAPETLDKQKISTYHDALKYMKPLEDFALLKQDFRVMCLLTQLEAIFKQQQEQ